jgi:hypothetical protein
VIAGGFLWPETKKAGQERDKMTDRGKRKGLHVFLYAQQALDFILVPEVGIEPTCLQEAGDFESPASTSFTTPAWRRLLRGGHPKVKKNVLTRLEILCYAFLSSANAKHVGL